jgi:HlyD family secretion protein
MATNIISNFPLDSVKEIYLGHIKKKSSVIYSVACALLLLSLVSSNFIRVPINIHSSAIIRPSTEISTVRSLTNGRLKESFVRENITVQKGDILYIIESEVQLEKERFLVERKRLVATFLRDLHKLSSSVKDIDFETAVYRQSYANYRQRCDDANLRLSKVQNDYNRNLKLYRENVIAAVEFESFQFELARASNERELTVQNQLSLWQNDTRDYEKEEQEINGQLAQLRKENEALAIIAPIAGTIQSVTGIYPGSVILASQELAQISPDTSLIIEASISPSDIGLIRAEMPVRFQIDAFNYNQWGSATGEVLEISDDIQMSNNRPIFKVRCRINQTYLSLKNGYKGKLKKGMTLQASFIVTNRTLWQLFYDKVDDWVNPNTFRSSV